MKNDILYTVKVAGISGLLVMCIAFFVILSLSAEIRDLKEYRQTNELMNAERNFNHKCPICGNDVELHSTKDGEHWYITCNSYRGGCGLHTGYYRQPEELVEDWNMLGTMKEELK